LHDCLDNSVTGKHLARQPVIQTTNPLKPVELDPAEESMSKYGPSAREASSGKQVHRE